jgi:SAM-dependent methyltransferase
VDRRACEICGHSGEHVVVHTGRDYLLGSQEAWFHALQCANCGFQFLDSPPEDLTRYYPARYFSMVGETPPGLAWIKKALDRHEARGLCRLVPRARSVLEIGPGHGAFLLALRDAYPGAVIRGFDVTTEAGLERRIAPDISVSYAAGLEHAGFADGEFDLIVMRHVLEHVPDLARFLWEIRRVCGAQGALYVKVPNRSSWPARLFGRYWNGLDFPRHLRYFRVSDLAVALRGAGFEVSRAGHEADAVDWVGSLRFLCADRLKIPVRGSQAWALLFLGIRVLGLPVSLLTRLCSRSSRVWVLARKEGG